MAAEASIAGLFLKGAHYVEVRCGKDGRVSVAVHDRPGSEHAVYDGQGVDAVLAQAAAKYVHPKESP